MHRACVSWNGNGPKTHRVTAIQGHTDIHVSVGVVHWTKLQTGAAQCLFEGTSHSF